MSVVSWTARGTSFGFAHTFEQSEIACFESSIVERIDEDLDLHAKKKKLLRLADAKFLAGQTPDLPKLQVQLREFKVDNIELETGRPRTVICLRKCGQVVV
jgi:hypothetical protein